MNHTFFFLLGMGGGSGGAPATTSQTIIGFLPLILIVAVFYFLMIRPQQKKQKETQRMLSELKKGDRIVTIGGVHGVVQSVREGAVIIKVDENCKIEFSRSAVASIEAQSKGGRDEESSEGTSE